MLRRRTITLTLALAIVLTALLPAGALASSPISLTTRWRGEIEALPDTGLIGEWTVGGRVVTVGAQTVIDESRGAAVLGALVQVLALGPEGETPLAIFIHVVSSSQQARVTRMVGIVEELGTSPAGERYLIMNRQRIILTSETTYENEGALAEGAFIKATVRIENETMVALHVEVRHQYRYVPLNGIVTAIDEATGLWTIMDDEGETRTVLVTEDTELRDDPTIDDHVRGQAIVEEDGSLTAVLIAVCEEPQPEAVVLEGPIQRFPTDLIGRWLIAGEYVIVEEATVITGAEPQVGALVVVEGLRYGNGTIKADTLDISETVENLSFEAIIAELPTTAGLTGRWVVTMADGETRKLQVYADTVLTGEMAVGATVRVSGEPRGRTTWAATEITVTAPAPEDASGADEGGKPPKPENGRKK